MSDVNNLKIKTKVIDGNVVISMPIDLLAFACENRMDGMAHKVSDLSLFGKEIAERIEFVNTDHDGSTGLTKLLDDVFEEMYASGIDCYDEDFEKQKEEPFPDNQ